MLSVAAAVGGFLFGFDSSVINGAVDAVENKFELSSFVTGFVVAIALLGCAAGRLVRRPLGGPLGPHPGHADRRGPVLRQLARRRPRLLGVGPGVLAAGRRPRHRHRLGDRPRLHRRDRAGVDARAAGIVAADGDHASASSSRCCRTRSGPTPPAAPNEMILGLEAWRWMFIVGVIPSAVYGVLALQIPESPRYLVADRRGEAGRRGAAPLGRDERTGAQGRGHPEDHRPRAHAVDEGPARQHLRAAADRLGRVSRCPRSSSWSAST